MKSSKKIALSAILCALGAALMFLGGLLGVLDISSACIVSFILLFIYIEVGKVYAVLSYAVISVLGFLVCGQNLFAPACLTFFFGPMVLTKFLFEKCGKVLSWIFKLSLPSAIMFLVWLFAKDLLELPSTMTLQIVYFASAFLIAFLTHILYIRLTAIYMSSIRHKILRFLK